MTIENNDRLLVNRGSTSHQITYEKIKDDILEAAQAAAEDAPVNGKQYGRQDSTWTEIVHTEEYTDADVDAHLNTNLANGGQILSWDGVDYKWVADQTGSGGGGSSDASLISYQYPSGVSRSVESRLNDSVSVKDFGAKGDGVTDDTVAFNAAIQTGKQVNIPAGTYVLSSTITSSGRNVTFIGEGSRNTYLQYNGSGDGFDVNIDKNGNADFTAQFEGFRIHSTNDSSSAGIRIRSDDPVGEIFAMALLNNLHVSGRWAQGIVLDSVRICKLKTITLGLNRATEGISLIGACMDSVLSGIVCSNVLNGNGAAIFIGGEAEGIHIEQSTIINCTTGIQMDTNGFEPSLYIGDTHTNCRGYGVIARNVGQMNIHDNLFYAYTGVSDRACIGLYIEGGGANSIINNNIFHNAGRSGYEDKGIVWNSSNQYAVITGNMFYEGEVGIETFNNGDNLALGDNHFNNVTDKYRASSGNLAVAALEVDENNAAFVVQNKGSSDKNAQLKLINNGKEFKLGCRKDGGGSMYFEDNMSFSTNDNGPREVLRLNDNGTARFYNDLYVSSNGLFEQNLSINGNFNVIGQTTFSDRVTVNNNVIVNGNVTAGNNLYVGEAGNPNQKWLLSVDSNGNILTVRQ